MPAGLLLVAGLPLLGLAGCPDQTGGPTDATADTATPPPDGDSGTPVVPPGAPQLALTLGPKQLDFTWDAVEGASFYRLREQPRPGADPRQLVESPDTSWTERVALWRVWRAAWVAWACNDGGCTPSDALPAPDLTGAIPYVKPADPASLDWFGQAVALSGDGSVLAVGSRATLPAEGTKEDAVVEAGAVDVFRRGDVGGWQLEARLRASDPTIYAAFGASVALDDAGEVLVVGSPDAGVAREGVVHVFRRQGGDWVEEAVLVAEEGGELDRFGTRVAVSGSGSTLAASAPRDDGPGDAIEDVGAVFVFSHDGKGWGSPVRLAGSGAGALDRMGASLALSQDGRVLVAGAPGDDGPSDDLPEADAGAAWVFRDDGSAWGEAAVLRAGSPAAGATLGEAVAVSGDGGRIAAGAPLDDGPGGSVPASGAVVVFEANGAGWEPAGAVRADTPGAADRLGTAVALSADGATLVVGSPEEASTVAGLGAGATDDDTPRSGAAYVFEPEGDGWSLVAFLKAPNPGRGDVFGRAVALSADAGVLAVGAQLEDGAGAEPTGDGAQDAGAVYLY